MAAERFDALSGLGFACADLDLAEEAIEALQQAIAARPDDARVKAKLAALYDASGRDADAIKTLFELRASRGLSPEEHRTLGLLCNEAARYEEAVEPLT